MIDRRFFVAGTLAMTVAGLPHGPSTGSRCLRRRPARGPATPLDDGRHLPAMSSPTRTCWANSLIYFGYTGCPDVCPTTLSVIAETMDALGDRPKRIVPIFRHRRPGPRHRPGSCANIPASCTRRSSACANFKAYTDHMVRAFNARYEVHVPDPDHPDRYSIDHTASVALVAPDGFLIKRYPHGTTADQMSSDLSAILAEVLTPTRRAILIGRLASLAGRSALAADDHFAPPAASLARPAAPVTSAAGLEMTDGNGNPVPLSTWAGQVIVLNLWAPWCLPCRREMPSLARLADRLAGRSAVVLPLAFRRQGASAVRQFLRRSVSRPCRS
ncbi:MAG: TlpA family protein disulfide reductase [Paracoccaceae bacterium]